MRAVILSVLLSTTLVLCSPALRAQTLLAQSTNAFFISIDPTVATPIAPLLGRIQNFTFEDENQVLGGGVFTGIFVGFGTYGPIFETSGYLTEFFWFSTVNGNVGGIQTLDLGSGSFTPPNLGTTEYLGAKFSRTDGANFTVRSINTFGDLEGDMIYGFALQNVSDLLNFQRIGAAQGIPVGGGTGGNMFTFVMEPRRISEIRFDDSGQNSPIGFSGSGFVASARVLEVVWRDGARWLSPVDDPFLLDGMFTISGTNAGVDLTTLLDFASSDAQLTVNSTTAGVWSAALPFAGTTALRFALGGQHRHRPREVTDLQLLQAPLPSAELTPSQLTNVLVLQLRESPLAFVSVRTDLASGPRISGIHFDQSLQQAASITTGAAVLPFGGMEFAAINLEPNAEVFNLFAVNNSSPVGTGPFFGIPFGAAQLRQLLVPIGAEPIHVMSDAQGLYEWGIPSGTLPAGITIDGVTIVISSLPGIPIMNSQVLRLNF